jgi:hypothetical protein
MLNPTRDKIIAARKTIWLNEPADIARLRTKKGARHQGASAVLYATAKLGQLAVFLNHLRQVAQQNKVDLETMRVTTNSLLEFYAGQYGGFYGLTDAAQVVRLGKDALAEVKTLEEYVQVAGELALYVSRVDYWVDFLVPWAKFGEVYEQIAAQQT